VSRRRNSGTVLALVGIVLGMVGLSFAAVPLYRMFCAATGYDGTTQRAAAAPGEAGGPLITVRFDAATATDLGWSFRPVERSVTLHAGEQRLVSFEAINRTSEPITGRATFNVTPLKAGIYFDKIQCFCFEEQRLKPGEKVEMPVTFFVDPALLTDPTTSEIRTITLSYTMFRAKDDAAAVAQRPEPTDPRRQTTN
jgi:cytochrome c oxidase assembly protein subunit 11